METLRLVPGLVPPRARGLIVEWAAQRQTELRRAWEQCRARTPVDPIPPME